MCTMQSYISTVEIATVLYKCVVNAEVSGENMHAYYFVEDKAQQFINNHSLSNWYKTVCTILVRTRDLQNIPMATGTIRKQV